MQQKFIIALRGLLQTLGITQTSSFYQGLDLKSLSGMCSGRRGQFECLL
jgi:hypothetical protein